MDGKTLERKIDKFVNVIRCQHFMLHGILIAAFVYIIFSLYYVKP